MGVRINHRVNVGAKAGGVDSSSFFHRIGNCGPRNEATALDGPQFPDRGAVAAYDKGSSGLYFTQS